MFSNDIGIDLGTASVLVYLRGRGIVLMEPSVVAINKDTGAVMEVGTAARRMLGRTPDNILAIKPMSQGVISDYDVTEKMLRYFVKKVLGKSVFALKPRIAVCAPSAVTEVERKAVIDAAKQAGAREVYIIEEPIAAAIGAGIDISQARGSMVVDIGGGTTDIAVISLGGCVLSSSIKVAGDNLDDALISYIKKKYNLMIGERTAEDLKINIGTAHRRAIRAKMDIIGRNLSSGLPQQITVTSDETYEALQETISEIIHTVHGVMEKTPPELVADISERGVVLTGGSSLLHGLDDLMSQRLRINVVLADDPIACVALGTGKYIEHLAKYKTKQALAGSIDSMMAEPF